MKMYRDETDKNPKDSFDEYSIRDQPAQPSFYECYGFNEWDGPSEEDEEVEDDEPWGKSDPRRW